MIFNCPFLSLHFAVCLLWHNGQVVCNGARNEQFCGFEIGHMCKQQSTALALALCIDERYHSPEQIPLITMYVGS